MIIWLALATLYANFHLVVCRQQYLVTYNPYISVCFIQESSAGIQDINKNMEMHKLEHKRDEQARSINETPEDKDAEIDKV